MSLNIGKYSNLSKSLLNLSKFKKYQRLQYRRFFMKLRNKHYTIDRLD